MGWDASASTTHRPTAMPTGAAAGTSSVHEAGAAGEIFARTLALVECLAVYISTTSASRDAGASS